MFKFNCHPFSLTFRLHVIILAVIDVDDKVKLSREYNKGLLFSKQNRSKIM